MRQARECIAAFAAGVLALAGIFPAMRAQHPGVDAPPPVTLASMQDRYRPVLVFAPSTTPQLIDQLRILARGSHDLHDRNVLTVPLLLHEDNKPWGVAFNLTDIGQMSPTQKAAARRRFHIHPNDFTVILIGKDGGEKLRAHNPISLDTLCSTIDAMPMRQEEMRQQEMRNAHPN